MSEKVLSEYLVDNITNVTFANGVFRVTLSQVGKGDEVQPVVRLFIPANQFSPILNGLTRAGRNIALPTPGTRRRRRSPRSFGRRRRGRNVVRRIGSTSYNPTSRSCAFSF